MVDINELELPNLDWFKSITLKNDPYANTVKPLEEQLIGGEYLEWELGLISETLRRLMIEEVKIPTLWKGYEKRGYEFLEHILFPSINSKTKKSKTRHIP